MAKLGKSLDSWSIENKDRIHRLCSSRLVIAYHMSESLAHTHPYLRPRKFNDQRRRWLIIAILLAILFHLVLIAVASNYRVHSLAIITNAVKQTREFVVTSIPSALDRVTAANPAGESPKPAPGVRQPQPQAPANFERAFNAPQPKIAPPEPVLPQAPTANINTAVSAQPSLLRITDEGLIPVGSVIRAQPADSIITGNGQNALPNMDFDLPSAIPGTLASEDLSSIQGAGRGLGGVRTDDLPGLEELARLFDPSKVQAIETPQGVTLRLSNEVLFEFNSAEITPEAIPVLKEVAQLLRRYAGAQLSIEGHTDTIGPADFNQRLSEQRAQAVANWLASQPAMIFRTPPQVIGYGESRPLVNPQGTREEQRPNRRVEIHIRAEKRLDQNSPTIP